MELAVTTRNHGAYYMSEMVERVAATIVRAELGDDVDWETCFEGAKERYRTLARKAIEAMRDPTDDMMAAGRAANDNYASEVAPCSSFRANDCWKAMIDDALK